MTPRQWMLLMIIALLANLALQRVLTDLEIIRYTMVTFLVLACWWLVDGR